MKTAQQIAEHITDKHQHDRQYPVGKAQQMVLDALNITVKVNGHRHAQQIFDELGITVSSKRVGRASVPVVIVNTGGSGRHAYGDYDVWDAPSAGIDLSAVAQWVE